MILARMGRVRALALLFIVLFTVAMLLQAVIVVPLAAVEEGASGALEVMLRSWRMFDPERTDARVVLELALIAAVIAGTQVAFVSPLVGRPLVDGAGRSLRASVVTAVLLGMFIGGGVLLGVLQLVLLVRGGFGAASFDDLAVLGGDGVVATVFVVVWLMSGVVWTVALWAIGRSSDPNVLVLFMRRALAGTGLELALGIPLYAMARKREDCYCSLPAFWSILVGTTTLFWLCGPGAVLFATRAARRGWARGACEGCGYPRRTGAEVCSECGRRHG